MRMSVIGKTLAHYEITSQLGKGGMGEVYQAKDRKLGRDVAIKVLPEEFARDTERVARFQREAKLLASLNHPNIAAIHGLEESSGTNFLVLELVEGQTLADRLKAGPIPVEEALKLALQIAEALEAAHEKGVIHRDLKPANIKVTPDGKVKVLDFGLAKAFAGEQSDLNLANSPTLSDAATQQGVILGTAAYMSPEQARGKAVDKRADVWAFGCVLYEMLTGQAAFQGEDVTEILASVVKSGANLDLLPANLHSRAREVITRCLQKDLKRRYSSVADARYEIEQALADPGGLFVQPVSAAKPRKRLQLGLARVAAVAVVASIIVGLAVWYLKPESQGQHPLITRFPLEAEGISTSGGIALSADGSKLVYAADKDGVRQLFLRARDRMSTVSIPDTKDGACPFFSPDGNWVGFFNGSELKKISLSGGLSQTLCKASYRYGATWGSGDTIIFATADSPGLMRVSASGGDPQPLTKSESGAGLHRWPHFMPDGKAVLYTIFKNTLDWQVAVLPLETKNPHVLIDGTDARYTSSGHLVFARQSSLWAVPFDSVHLQYQGDAVPIVEGVQVNSGGWAQYSVASDGSMAYLSGSTPLNPSTRPVWVDRKGQEELMAAPSNNYSFPRISPDGKQIALRVRDSAGNSDIWIWDCARGTLSRLTFDTKSASPLWTLDGKRIAFLSSRNGNQNIFWKAADGTGEDEKLVSVNDRALAPYSWSSDGKVMVLIELNGANFDIATLSMEGDHTRKPLLHEKYNETYPSISPDGQWIAYESDESGRYEVYVRPFPEVNKGKWQMSTGGGSLPVWSPDGRELFYRSGDTIMTLTVKTKPTFSAGKPEPLARKITDWETVASGLSLYNLWDISPDGKRFLVIRSAESAASASGAATPAKINIVLNWFEELKQRVPVK
jgi:serine/threonine-protein kinase